MGKIRKEYRDDRMESYGSASHSSESSRTSGSSDSSFSDSGSSDSLEKKRKHSRKRNKYKKEKKKRSESEEEMEYIEREKRKRKKLVKQREEDEVSDDEYLKVEERKHRSRKHKHHHRKHKHKHRRHRHHHTDEEFQEKRRGGSEERGDRREREEWERGNGRKERDELDDRRISYDKYERDRRSDKDSYNSRKLKKEDRRGKERGETRQVKSKWDEDEDVQYSINKRIKPDPDAVDVPRVKQERDRSKKRRVREDEVQNGSWGPEENAAQNIKQEDTPPNQEVHKPNMGLSGKLTEDTNTFNGVVIKYSQPPEARKPKRRWRWYIFKGEEDLPFLPLHRQSAYLIGRDRKVADIPTDHPSCSKQHAVLQYRLVTYAREDGAKGRTVKPYILDLESANGTYVNNRRIDPRRFVELIEKDVVKFGYSSREYILLHEGSKGEDADAPDMGVELSPISLLRSK